jgi:hypothetical protein
MKNILSLLALFCIFGNSHSVWGAEQLAMITDSSKHRDNSTELSTSTTASAAVDVNMEQPVSVESIGGGNANPPAKISAVDDLARDLSNLHSDVNSLRTEVTQLRSLMTRGVGLVLFAATSYVAYYTVGKWAVELAKKRLQAGDEKEGQPQKTSPYLLKGIRVISSLSAGGLVTAVWLYIVAPRMLRA